MDFSRAERLKSDLRIRLRYVELAETCERLFLATGDERYRHFARHFAAESRFMGKCRFGEGE